MYVNILQELFPVVLDLGTSSLLGLDILLFVSYLRIST